MRFEAMNQVFKKIAIGGSYRDTTRRLAEFWCLRSALARQRDHPWDDWACTRVLANSGVVTSARASAPAHVLKALELWPDTFGEYVRTSLISELQHDGHTILAASSWLYFTTDSTKQPWVASLHPTSGIFSIDSTYFFHLVLHPGVSLSDPTPLRTAHIPAALGLVTEIVCLDEILEMQILWPSACNESSDGKVWSFTQL